MPEETPAQDSAPEPDREPEHKHEFEEYPPDHPLVKRLETLKAELKEAKPKAKRLTELEEAAKSEAEKAADRIAAETARAETAEKALLRYEVATELGIPGNALKFLTGTDRAELTASGKEVLELLGDAAKPRPPKPDPNQGRTSPEATDPASQFASFLQQQLNTT